MNTREAFEAHYRKWAANPEGDPLDWLWSAWQAAERATAQRCRELCRREMADWLVKEDGLDAAGNCADAIAREFGLVP